MACTIEERTFFHNYEYIVMADSTGYRCGYVEIPESSVFYGKGYIEIIPELNVNPDNLLVGKKSLISLLSHAGKNGVNMAILFDVHGGITCSQSGCYCSWECDKDSWWIGFDCNHYQDLMDKSIMDEEHKRLYSDNFMFGLEEYHAVRTKEYVRKECKNLILQVIKYDFNNPMLFLLEV